MSTNNIESIKNKVQENVVDTNAGDSESLETDGKHNESFLSKCFQFLSNVLLKLGIFTMRDKHPKPGGLHNSVYTCCILHVFMKIKEYFKDKHLIPGGLHNSASTCYMNAMIQALSSSDILISSIESLSKSHSNSSVSLLYNLLNALNEENINNETVMRNTKLLENLIESVGWTKPSQQDAFDLLSALICDIYKNTDKINKIEIPLRIKLLHEFQGIDIGNRVQEYLGLSLNLCGNYQNPPGVPLQYLIDQHFISSAIDGDISKLTRSSLYREIPNILLIHIQANKWDPISCQMKKPIYYIQYDENMTFGFDIANEINGENRNLNEDRIPSTKVEYHLKSIVYYVGNISGGHYVAYRKWREEWYLADDDTIKKEPLNKSISPYIMIYERTSI